MPGTEFVASGYAAIIILLVLLYAVTIIASHRFLLWRLPPGVKPLATLFMLAQVLVITMATIYQPSSAYEEWLWHVDREFNIPSILASAQFAVCAGVALLTALFTSAISVLGRIHLLLLSAVFLLWAGDEYLMFHEFVWNWHLHYARVGAIIVLATAIVALFAPRQSWHWYLCLLAGLALTAIGAIVVERLPLNEPSHLCDELGLLRFDPCLLTYRFEEALEFIGVWLALVALLGLLSAAAPRPGKRLRAALLLLPALWLCCLLAYALFPRLELFALRGKASADFANGVRLAGYSIETGESATRVKLFAHAGKLDYMDMGYSIHLVDQASGESRASYDKRADQRHNVSFLSPADPQIYRTTIDVRHPAGIPRNRAFWVVLTLWRELAGEFVSQSVLSSDLQALDEAQVVLGELALPADISPAPSAPLSQFDNGFLLTSMELPERALPGGTLYIPVAWHSQGASNIEYVQFLHLQHQESGEWWVYDQHPLGPRLPTRLWHAGLSDSETWRVPLPADLAPGHYQVHTGLYRTSDQERVPARDAAGNPFQDARVPVGVLIVD